MEHESMDEDLTHSQPFHSSAQEFNEPIGHWNTSSLNTMFFTFANSGFDQPINTWDVSKVTSMNGLFLSSPFNQPLSSWSTSQVSDFTDTFNNAHFDQDLSSWDVSNARSMLRMFLGRSSFTVTDDLVDWDVSKVENFREMFAFSSFNQNINCWNVSSGEEFSSMFEFATKLKRDLSKWNVRKGCRFNKMFKDASSFNADLNSWHSQVTTNSNCPFLPTFGKMFQLSACPIQTNPVPGPFCQPFNLRTCLRKAFRSECTCAERTECLESLRDACEVSFLAAGGTLTAFNNKSARFFDDKCDA
jgi:hypothetical protein